MQLQDKYRIALLAAYAIGLHSFESLLPSPVPWLKLGLANIITLVTLLLYGMRTAIAVTLIRVILVSLFTGTFLGPAFILSLGGGIISTVTMGFIFSGAEVIQRHRSEYHRRILLSLNSPSPIPIGTGLRQYS
jgi:heptaprenyl diphosphate synthase